MGDSEIVLINMFTNKPSLYCIWSYSVVYYIINNEIITCRGEAIIDFFMETGFLQMAMICFLI